MYDDIGSKIKGLAKAVFIIESIAAVIIGISIMATGDDSGDIGFLVMLVGPFVAWVSSWLLYGLGQLIENSDIIAEEYKQKALKSEIKNNERQEKEHYKKAKAIIANSSVEEDAFVDILCPNCKEELSFTKKQLQNGENLVCPMCDSSITFK